MKEDADVPVSSLDNSPWDAVEEEKREKAMRVRAYELSFISLILSFFAAPKVGTGSRTPFSDILTAYVIGMLSCLFVYFSLRTRFTLVGVVVLGWSVWMFYPMLQQALQMWAVE